MPTVFKLVNPKNSSDPDNEIIRFKALKNANLENYAIVDKTFDSNGVESDVFRHLFRFPPTVIKAGEYVRLYTGEGSYIKVVNKTKQVVHCFYWNSEECVWNNKGDTAILIYYKIEDFIKVPAVKK